MSKSPSIMTGPEAYAQALRKNVLGRRDWVTYKTRAGELVAEVLTAESLKRALLATGTKRSFTQLVSGHRLKLTWRTGLNLLYQLRFPHGGGPGICPPPRSRPRSSYSSRGNGQQLPR